MPNVAIPHIKALQNALLRWYRRYSRALPWRTTQDPYAIWLSEIMLQQTQVATVIGYYRRFLQRFPDVYALAAAQQQEVLKLWEGLGYYRRARHLHRAAGVVVREYDGVFPATAEELRRLPGVGPYTAGAIASIAFDADEPVVDGNVSRVLSRVLRIRSDIKAAVTQKKLWKLARELIPPGKASLFNQALMDLGATICTPKKPQCLDCPVKKHCQALAHDQVDALPVKRKAPRTPHYDVGIAVIVKRGRVLIARRPDDVMLGGLWEFPGGKRQGEESMEQCAIREVKEELGVTAEVVELLVVAKHAYSHFRVSLHAFLCRHLSGRARPIEAVACRWVSLEQLNDYPFPKGSRKIIDALLSRYSTTSGR